MKAPLLVSSLLEAWVLGLARHQRAGSQEPISGQVLGTTQPDGTWKNIGEVNE
jgi:hypothetical protein